MTRMYGHVVLAGVQAAMATAGFTDLIGPRAAVAIMAGLAGLQAALAVAESRSAATRGTPGD
jgi:hypothetical protein